jgi:hypothetical protein
MIDKTVLILGAGASCHYGFPTGEGLIKEVWKLAHEYGHGQQRCYLDQKFKEGEFECLVDIFNNQCHVENQNDDTKKSPETLKELFKSIASKIEHLDPLNIDTFLRDNPSLQDVGTFLIAYVLLGYEEMCSVRPIHSFNGTKKDNWYRFLIHVFAACDNSEELKKVFLKQKKLSIITFNYDVSLEYHLYNSLKQIEKFQDDARNFMKAFSENCIFHVYGALHAIDWDEPDPFAEFGTPSESSDGFDFFKKVKLARQCSQNIKTIYKAKDNKCPKYTEKKKKFIEAIDQSKRLVILGYGFDDANTKHLSEISENDSRGLVKALSHCLSNIQNQRLLMTNYGDSKRIQNKITKKINPLIFISDKNVYNALMHDFDLV